MGSRASRHLQRKGTINNTHATPSILIEMSDDIVPTILPSYVMHSTNSIQGESVTSQSAPLLDGSQRPKDLGEDWNYVSAKNAAKRKEHATRWVV